MADLASDLDRGGLRGTWWELARSNRLGILSTSGVGTFSGSTLALAALLDAQSDVAGANALRRCR